MKKVIGTATIFAMVSSSVTGFSQEVPNINGKIQAARAAQEQARVEAQVNLDAQLPEVIRSLRRQRPQETTNILSKAQADILTFTRGMAELQGEVKRVQDEIRRIKKEGRPSNASQVVYDLKVPTYIVTGLISGGLLAGSILMAMRDDTDLWENIWTKPKSKSFWYFWVSNAVLLGSMAHSKYYSLKININAADIAAGEKQLSDLDAQIGYLKAQVEERQKLIKLVSKYFNVKLSVTQRQQTETRIEQKVN